MPSALARGRRGLAALALAVVTLAVAGPARADAPRYTVRPNVAGVPTPQQVVDRGQALHRRLVDAGLWPARARSRTEGGTRFRHLGASRVPLSLAEAMASMRDLGRLARQAKVPAAKGDLVHVHAIDGDVAALRLTLYLFFAFPLSEHVALPTRIQFSPLAQPDQAAAAIRYRAEDGFVRLLDLDVVLVPEAGGTTVVAGYELTVRTDWRGVAVTRAMFDHHVVRKVRAIMDALVGAHRGGR